MTTRVDVEEIESTRSEKFLAVVLLAFLLIGTIWFYVEVDDWVPGGDTWEYTPAEQKVSDRQAEAWETHAATTRAVKRERSELDLAKNRLDIALAKGGDSSAAEAEYNAAERELLQATAHANETRRDLRRAEAALERIDRAREDRNDDTGHEWVVAGLRLGFIAVWFAGALRLLSALRQRQSRFLPLGFAAAGAGVVTALVFATDYVTEYLDPFDVGPIVLSAAGAAATIGSFVGLQRWLARRIPGRRVRNGECPFCGHPVRGGVEPFGAPHCEGCGREVIAACASCDAPRRVGSPHCAACGAA